MTMKNLLPLLAAFLFAGCIGLEGRLKDAQTDYEIRFDEKLAEYEEGKITEEELEDALEEIREERNDVMEDAIDEQVDAIVEAPGQIIGTLTGNTWIDILLGAAGIAEGARRYTNWDRDGRRRKRGEPVGEQPTAK